MGVDDIVELITLLVFLLAPLLQRLRRRAAGAPRDVAEQGPISPPVDYGAHLERQLRGLRSQIQARKLRLRQSPLLGLPILAEMAERLVVRGEEALDRALLRIDASLADQVPVAARPLERARAAEAVQLDLVRSHWVERLLTDLADQRVDGRQAELLARLDRILAELGTRRAPDVPPRQRLALLWDDDPYVPGLWVGSGATGLAPIPRAAVETASGWGTATARAVGFDLLAQRQGALDELRRQVRVGPLADRPPPRTSQASEQLNLDVALATWTANLAADVTATAQLGRPYALGLIREAERAGVGEDDVVTIRTRDGRYDPEPPLLLRMMVVDRALDDLGWADADTGVEALRDRIGWSDEAYYDLPTRMRRRVLLEPLLRFFSQVADAFVAARLETAGRRRLLEMARSHLAPVDESALEAIKRAYLARRIPVGPPLHLLGGAILAEADPTAERGARYLQEFINALARRALPRTAVAPDAMSDRALIREAMVLSGDPLGSETTDGAVRTGTQISRMTQILRAPPPLRRIGRLHGDAQSAQSAQSAFLCGPRNRRFY